MNDHEAKTRRVIAMLETAFPSGTGGWSKKRFELWVEAVLDMDPDALSKAAAELVQTWTDDRGRAPQIGNLRALAKGKSVKTGMTFAERLPDDQVAPVFHAYLWQAAMSAAMRDRGEVVTTPPGREDYAAIVERHGLRPVHGCGEFTDSIGRLHAPSPYHEPERVKICLAEAKEVFERSGQRDSDEARKAVLREMAGPRSVE